MDGCCPINPMSFNFYQNIKYSANSIAELVCCGCHTELSHLETCLGSSPLQIQLLEFWEVSQSVRRSGYDHLLAPKQIKERAAVEREDREEKMGKRIIESWDGLFWKGPLKLISFQAPAMAHLPLDQVTPSSVQPGLEGKRHSMPMFSFEQNETEHWMGNYKGWFKGLLLLIRH